MTPHVMKRDGCKVPFKSERIQEAILRAAKAAGVDDADYCATVAEVVSSQMNERSQVDINEIQTAVENQLMAGPYKQLARAYIEYRHDRDVQREKRGRLNQEIRGLVEQTNSALLNENDRRPLRRGHPPTYRRRTGRLAFLPHGGRELSLSPQ